MTPQRPAAAPTADERARRKALGAFYTPSEVVDLLVRWAVDGQTNRVLDPSFGDGRFLRAALAQLTDAGALSPELRLYGAELDPSAARQPVSLNGAKVPRRNLIEGDFFKTSLDSWDGKRFDAIVGNPPYVRHHLLPAESKRFAREHAQRVGISLSERADAWAYFCAAVLDYLEPRGRLALLLPGAVLHADYALPLLHALSESRGRVRLIRVQERLFDDAMERTVVLLLDGRHTRAGVEYREVKDLQQLKAVLTGKRAGPRGWRNSASLAHTAAATPELRLRTRLRWLVSQEVADLWERVDNLPEVGLFGDVAEVRIGVVTGANRFFVLDADAASRFEGPGIRTVPIVSRGGWLNRARWTGADQLSRRAKPSRLLLIQPDAQVTRSLRQAIAMAVHQGVDQRSHCQSREPWYSLRDSWAPRIFLPYMGATPPRLVVNDAEATCTNAIHRVRFKPNWTKPAATAAASWTSLWRLSAELIGRSYGAGVLKLEPNEAVQMRLPLLPHAGRHLGEIERALEDGQDTARDAADRLLLREALGLSSDEIAQLKGAAEDLERRRCH